jgi:hypothetical protein
MLFIEFTELAKLPELAMSGFFTGPSASIVPELAMLGLLTGPSASTVSKMS